MTIFNILLIVCTVINISIYFSLIIYLSLRHSIKLLKSEAGTSFALQNRSIHRSIRRLLSDLHGYLGSGYESRTGDDEYQERINEVLAQLPK